MPNRFEAAKWYGAVLGLEILSAHEDWATEGGPLMISSDSGNTMIALFEGQPQGSEAVIGIRRIAFRVDGAGFIAFCERLEKIAVHGQGGNRISSADVVDHQKAFSIYFCDPYGNPYEITTYDYNHVHQNLL